FGSEEIFLIKPVKGNIDINDVLLKYLREEGLKLPKSDPIFLKQREKTRFVREDPPVQYTIIVLWNHILRGIEKEKYSIKDVRKEIEDNYTLYLMENINGNRFRIRKSWLEEAFEIMENLDLVEKEGNKYRAKFEKNIRKDFREYLLDRMAKEEKETENQMKKLV
ncbi:hypothetical protein AKJ51_04400, partial [candidate division MSBL1 archaeon SCGC-AAA382A20]